MISASKSKPEVEPYPEGVGEGQWPRQRLRRGHVRCALVVRPVLSGNGQHVLGGVQVSPSLYGGRRVPCSQCPQEEAEAQKVKAGAGSPLGPGRALRVV